MHGNDFRVISQCRDKWCNYSNVELSRDEIDLDSFRLFRRFGNFILGPIGSWGKVGLVLNRRG